MHGYGTLGTCTRMSTGRWYMNTERFGTYQAKIFFKVFARLVYIGMASWAAGTWIGLQAGGQNKLKFTQQQLWYAFAMWSGEGLAWIGTLTDPRWIRFDKALSIYYPGREHLSTFHNCWWHLTIALLGSS